MEPIKTLNAAYEWIIANWHRLHNAGDSSKTVEEIAAEAVDLFGLADEKTMQTAMGVTISNLLMYTVVVSTYFPEPTEEAKDNIQKAIDTAKEWYRMLN